MRLTTKDERRIRPIMPKRVVLVAGALLATVIVLAAVRAARRSPKSAPVADPRREVERLVHVSAPRGARTPSGCDIIDLSFRVVGGAEESSDVWTGATVSLCQLPPEWRSALERHGVHGEVEYVIPRSLVPEAIALRLGVSLTGDVRLVVRVRGIYDAPAGLSFPGAAPMPGALRLSDGERYAWLTTGDGRYVARERGAVAVHHSVWSPDGTLVGSTLLGTTPSIVDLRDEVGFWRELLVGASEGARAVVWTTDASSPTGKALIVDATLVKVIR